MGKLRLQSGNYYEVLLHALTSAIKANEQQILEAYTEVVKKLDQQGEILSQHEECDVFLKITNECTQHIADFQCVHAYLSGKYLNNLKTK